MDYEELYGGLMPLEKRMKDMTAAAQRAYKAVAKDTETGDLKALARDMAVYADSLKEQAVVAEEIRGLVEGFDARAYFESGDFARQMLKYCQEASVDVQGETPVFEIFPYRLRIDEENQDLYLNRKKVTCMRPLSFVSMVKSSQDRLMKAPFNAQAFLNELSEAYDLVVLKQKKRDGADLYLGDLYRMLVPMSRFRRDYDQQSFAYDLARLYASDVEQTKSGRRYQFGPSRNNNKAIRILDSEGREQYLATIRFFHE
ncbi:MAG: hypothetical protein Q4F28_14940 [Eubacteriales bacterium]|nr:hypothetical protein [Eubacteriales bacterium]